MQRGTLHSHEDRSIVGWKKHGKHVGVGANGGASFAGSGGVGAERMLQPSPFGVNEEYQQMPNKFKTPRLAGLGLLSDSDSLP